MNCGYGEKLILYFYGEAGSELKAGVESHLKTCAACRAALSSLSGAEAWLTAATVRPPAAAVEAVMRQARETAVVKSGWFVPGWTEAVFAGALAAVMAGLFAFSPKGSNPELAWNSGLDSGLDAVEYSIYQAQSEMAAPQADWDYRYEMLEYESRQEQGKA
jgi:hypothetical protein